MRILAIDPGTTESGWCMIDCRDGALLGFGIAANEVVLHNIPSRFGLGAFSLDRMAIEMVASYGMAVGKETFRTVWWAGRFAEQWRRACGSLPDEIYRADVKSHLCKSAKANDANIRQALIDVYGGEGGKAAAIGSKANPGPLFGVSKHVWAALAVAVTARARLPIIAEAA